MQIEPTTIDGTKNFTERSTEAAEEIRNKTHGIESLASTTIKTAECQHSWIQDAAIKVCYHCGYKPQSVDWKKAINKMWYSMQCQRLNETPTYVTYSDFEGEIIKVLQASSLALLREVSEQVIGEDQDYSRQAQAVIDRRNADPMCKTPYPREARWKDERNRLKAEQRKALETLKKKYGGGNGTR